MPDFAVAAMCLCPDTVRSAPPEPGSIRYTATYDQVSAFLNVLEILDRVIKALVSARRASTFERWWRAGSGTYKTQDSVTWYGVTLRGFGDVGNYGFQTMESVGDYLYVGATNPFDGLEIWRGRDHE